MITVALADDQPLVREGLALILAAQPDFEVVGQSSDGQEAVELARHIISDVLLMDIRMPRVDGIEATRRIVESGCTSRVLILTTYDLDDYVYRALCAGASGYLLKTFPRSLLVQAIRTVCEGEVLVTPAETRRLIEHARVAQQKPPPGLSSLSDRELEVLREVATGASNAEIAGTLMISEKTVKTHVSHLLDKLQVRDRVHLVILAYEHDLTRRPRL